MPLKSTPTRRVRVLTRPFAWARVPDGRGVTPFAARRAPAASHPVAGAFGSHESAAAPLLAAPLLHTLASVPASFALSACGRALWHIACCGRCVRVTRRIIRRRRARPRRGFASLAAARAPLCLHGRGQPAATSAPARR